MVGRAHLSCPFVIFLLFTALILHLGDISFSLEITLLPRVLKIDLVTLSSSFSTFFCFKNCVWMLFIVSWQTLSIGQVCQHTTMELRHGHFCHFADYMFAQSSNRRTILCCIEIHLFIPFILFCSSWNPYTFMLVTVRELEYGENRQCWKFQSGMHDF